MKTLFVISALLLLVPAGAQDVPPVTEQQLENLGEENIEDDALLQQLSFFQKHPLNLNTAGLEELSLLRLLTALQMQSLLAHRAAFGNLLSIYELQAVPAFDLVTIQKILPFVYVGSAQSAKETMAVRLRGGSRFLLLRTSRVLERSRGYNRSLRTYYLGNPHQLQARYIYQYKNLLYYGLVADKDPGEQFFRGAQRSGFDFYSFHFFVRNAGRVKALAIGDYALNLGQGLVHWQSLAFGKSADVMQIKRQAPVLLPYRSAGEFYFSRGAAATLQFGPWQMTGFVSYKPFSGNVVPDSAERFTSFNTSGLHRTRLEVEDRNRIQHLASGGVVQFQHAGLKAGINAITHHFSLPLQKRDVPYNRFALTGQHHFLGSFDYSYTYRNAHFFGEVAGEKRGHIGMLHGAMISVDPKVDLSLLYRNIGAGFQSPFGNAFTESTLPGNELGLYTGIQLRPHGRWQLSAYADLYHFPFLRFRVSAPTRGWDYLAQLTYVPQKRTEIYLRYRTEMKPLNGTGATINYPVTQQRQNLRFHFVTQPGRYLTLKGRTEIMWFSNLNTGQEDGFLTYLEAAYAGLQKLRGNIRLQYFETDSYNSRIYAYESDVLYSFSIPGFFDKGFRYYLNLQYNYGKTLSFWLRLAQTAYRQRDRIGSGLDEIPGRHKTDIRVQMRYQF